MAFCRFRVVGRCHDLLSKFRHGRPKSVFVVGAGGLTIASAFSSSASIISRQDAASPREGIFCESVAAKLDAIHETEKLILDQMADTPYRAFNVPVSLDAGRRCFLETPKTHYNIRTVVVGENRDGQLPPIVLVHGYMMGAPAFFKLLPLLAADRTVYAIDVIGMGGSERPPFNAKAMTAEQAEELLVEPFERWAAAMQLSEFVLVGHSFGGFVSSCWATRSTLNIKGLILLSPLLGYSNERIAKFEERMNDSIWGFVIDAAWANHITPHALVRNVPGFKTWLAKSNERRFQGMASNITEDEGRLMSKYVVASMDMPSSAERAATVCFETWLRPVETSSGTIKQRLALLDKPLSAIYGDRDWMEPASPSELPNCKFLTLRESGHHLYWDNPADLASHVLSEARSMS
eukprot:TRINITY_DN3743_c0_g1_i2.p1 TRINITY_DN3743_c0_g1~~TRINITY_DN3743_c0_g1_i2.p1  ORF type:complete len:406 (+),score=40.87 TRINITY_DN3743_c0_g1_i2:86-1303(+)